MELKGERLIPAPFDTTWAALNNAEILKACIAGCESLERSGDDGFQAMVAVRVGPVSAKFKGKMTVTESDPPRAYTLVFEGQGGAAGFAKGQATVALTPQDGNTLLSYTAKATIGGKLAQVGSRLIDAAAGKIAEDFFTAFEAALRPAEGAAPAPAPAAGNKLLWWIVGAIVVIAAIWLLKR